jgi:hypothetical protein
MIATPNIHNRFKKRQHRPEPEKAREQMNKHPQTLILRLAACAVLLFFFIALSNAVAAEHSPGLDELALGTSDGETIPVILFLNGRLTMDDVYPIARSLPMDKRRLYVIETLKARYHETGDELFARLEAARKTGEVSLLRPLWIMNAIRVHLTPALLKEIEDAFPEIVYITTDLPHKNTLDNIGWGVQDMQAPRVWHDFGADGSGVIVGHRDSGVDYNHSGFTGHLWINPVEDLNHNGFIDTVERNGVDDDGNGYVDDFYGWDFDFDNAEVYDIDGHGTKTASVISSGFSPCDTVSVAPGAKLMVLQAYLYQGAVWEASQYAIEMGAQVISASVSFIYSDCMDSGVRECPNYVGHRIVSEMELAAGLLHANSTGNSGGGNAAPFSANAPSNCPPPVCTPDQPQQGGVSSIIAVAAYNLSGTLETYSGHGPSGWSRADYCSQPRMAFCGAAGRGNEYPPEYDDYPFQNRLFPGLIRPDMTGPSAVTSLGRGGGCSSISGTSSACPHVGGACALIFSKFPGITPEDAYLLLIQTAQDGGVAGVDTLWGYGKVRPAAACSAGVADRCTVNGSITANGSPLADVRISTTDSRVAFSDAQGSYQIWLAPGMHDVLFEKNGYNDTTITLTLSAGQSETRNLNLSAAISGTVTGTVFADGAGVPGMPITIPEIGLETTSHTGGAFTFDLSAGTYELHAGALPWGDTVQTIQMTGSTLNLNITLQRSPRAYPTGPDGYGYYIYDEYDTPSLFFNWVEVDPSAGGFAGQELNVYNDASVIVNLPFTFRFYGSDFAQMTVSAGGFIVMGAASILEYSEFPIPSASAPNGYLAVWFNDWEPANGSGVFYYTQTDSHRVIIEWSRVPDFFGRGTTATFQAIFYDPAYCPTPTGDGMVKYQYLAFNSVWEGGIGIENLDGTDGVEYMFLTMYDPHAVPIENGRALLLTTDSTLDVEPVVPPVHPVEFSLQQNWPNPFNPVTTFAWRVPRTMPVRLALYDVLGRETAMIFDGLCPAGEHTQSFDGTNLASGVYFARLEAAGQTAALRKVVLLK